MKQPCRLIDATQDRFERTLLLSAELDQVPTGALERTAQALGIAGALVGMASVAGATAMPAAKAAGGAAQVLAKSAWLTAAKSVVFGAVVGTIATGGYRLVAPPAGPDPAAQMASPPPRLRSASSPVAATGHGLPASASVFLPSAPAASWSAVLRPPRASAGVVAASAPTSGAPSMSHPPSLQPPPVPAQSVGSLDQPNREVGPMQRTQSSPAVPVPDGATTLEQETRALDQVRVLLHAGRPTEALAALDAHGRNAGSKALGTEATLLRIDALNQLGRRDEARHTASVLLASGIRGHTAERLRRMVGQD